MKIILAFLFLLFSLVSFGQVEGNFRIDTICNKCDFKTKNLKKINKIDRVDVFNKCFSFKKGNYQTIRLIEAFLGENYKDYKETYELIELHKIIILKVDEQNVIKEGYYYILENPEFPTSLFELQNENSVKIMDDIIILENLIFQYDFQKISFIQKIKL